MPSYSPRGNPAPVCVALVATQNRWELLTRFSLPSIRRQSRPPALALVVNDGPAFSSAEHREIEAVLSPVPAVVLQNHRAAGAAGAWNTGLAHLRQRGHDGFVAILDDDDAWDPCHLEASHGVAASQGAEVVVSGLRRVVDGAEVPRPLPERLGARDFLVGNPGWQGSNTYVSMARLAQVRGFRDGLASLNDRDLAHRLLRLSGLRVGYTGRWTSTWQVRSDHAALSAPRSPAKISGLRWFWTIYGPEMSADEAAAFFQRASRCFGVRADEITAPGDDLPPHTRPHGDLDS